MVAGFHEHLLSLFELMLADQGFGPEQGNFHGLGQRFLRLLEGIFHFLPIGFACLLISPDAQPRDFDPTRGRGAGQIHNLAVLLQGIIASTQGRLGRRHPKPR